MCMKGKCGRKNEKSQLTEDPKMAYNKGTKRQFTPASGFQVINSIKIAVNFGRLGGYFFVPIIITISTPNAIIKESVSYVLMLYHLLPEMEATQQ